MQLAVGAQKLNIEGAFVLGDAANGFAIAKTDGDRVIRSLARSQRNRAGIAERLRDLRERTVVPDT